MLNLKFLLTIALISVQTIMFAQEICNNAIDDDNDGLVDLNDDECQCDDVKPLTQVDGYICRDNLKLIMDDNDAISYQWYHDGVALIGQTESELVLMETPTVEGFYEVLVTLASGCYTSEPYKVEILTHEVYLGEEVICDGDTIIFGGFALTFEGFFQNNGYAVDGCDSITTLNVVVVQPTFGTVNGQICQGELFELNNISTTTPGQYFDTIPNTFGCDSIITLNLEEGDFQQRLEFGTICPGEIYEAYGQSLTTPGDHEILIENPIGCDTLVTLSLIETSPPTAALTVGVCPGELYEGFDIGIHELVVENPAGCDTIFTLTVQETQQPTLNLAANICEGDIYTEYGLSEEDSGMFEVVLPALDGCDTMLTIDLTVEEIPTEYIEAFICNGDIYTDYGLSETETGINTVTVEGNGVCDSIITIDLVVTNIIELNLSANICEGEEYNDYGIQTDVEGIHENSIISPTGCDSIITVNLTVGVPTESFITPEICESEYFELHDIYTDSAGVYQTVIQNSMGCDSTINVDLTVLIGETEEVFYSICEGEYLELNNEYYYEEDIYYTNLISEAGCDSSLILNLTVIEQPKAFREVFICKGETYEYEGLSEYQEGVYDLVIPNDDQCDSLITIQLFVIEPNEGIDLPYYNSVSYGSTIDITPDFMGEGVTNIIWMDDTGEEIGSGPILEDYMTLTDTHVDLVAIDANGCPVEARAIIDVTLDIDIFIPSIFTPDSEDGNGTFQIFGNNTVTGIKEIAIYDRWGELVYSATDQGINEGYHGWDGYFRGRKVIAGAYAYIIDFNIVTGAVVTKTGTITLAY